jgi:hypothetical protein
MDICHRSLKSIIVGEYIMLRVEFFDSEYENGYDSGYAGMYDQNFFFYDEEDLEESSDFDSYDEDFDSEDDSEEQDPSQNQDDSIRQDDPVRDDFVLDEISFMYCPGQEGEA